LRRHLREDVPALTSPPVDPALLRASRRRLFTDSLGILVGASGFGLVLGLASRAAGFSPIEVSAMSLFVFAGAAQFAAVGYVVGGFSWAGIVLLTAFLNSRHFLYSAALAPYFAKSSRPVRAVAAHLLTDEAFALAIAHFRRIGRVDVPGYFWAAIGSTFIPWNVMTLVGVLIGGQIPDPTRFGLDIIFPAAMAGLAVGLISGRREVVAAMVGTVVGVAVSLAWDPAAGIIAGGLLGPLAGMLVPESGLGRGRPVAPLPFGGASTDAKIEAGLGEDGP
jgi:4-azaleucine resistance transporter AzlC